MTIAAEPRPEAKRQRFRAQPQAKSTTSQKASSQAAHVGFDWLLITELMESYDLTAREAVARL